MMTLVDETFERLRLMSDEQRLELGQRINEYDREEGGRWLGSVETPYSILKAVRRILRCGESQSILERAVTVMRRYDDYTVFGKNELLSTGTLLQDSAVGNHTAQPEAVPQETQAFGLPGDSKNPVVSVLPDDGLPPQSSSAYQSESLDPQSSDTSPPAQ